MDLQNRIRKGMVMQWYQAYINYFMLKPKFQRLRQIFAIYEEQLFAHGSEYSIVREPSESHKKQISKLTKFINVISQVGYLKSEAFYQYKKLEIISFCQSLQSSMRLLSMDEIVTHSSCIQRFQLKTALKLIYANCRYLTLFLRLNRQINKDIKKSLKQFLIDQMINSPMNSSLPNSCEYDMNNGGEKEGQNLLVLQLKKQRKDSTYSLDENEGFQGQINEQIGFLVSIEKKIKQIYLHLTFFNQQKSIRLDELVDFDTKKDSNKAYILVGTYCGMSVLSFLAIILMLVFGLVQPSYDSQQVGSIYYVFPLFRGVGLLILYLWGMSWNIYGFCKYRISFRRILRYGSHYSTFISMIKRASFFSLVFCIMILLYFIGGTYNQSRDKDGIRFPVEYTPFVVWILYLGYIFFPNREVFNPKGRKYFYRVIQQVVLSPVGKMTFLIAWLTDQTVSFVVPIKDMSYTICFYTSNFEDNKVSQIIQCQNKTAVAGFMVAYLIALSPLLFRMIQCYRQAVQDKGKFIGHIQMWNFGKYISSVITATLSYISTVKEGFIVPLIISSIISTTYAYYWDLKYDWGFLQKSSKHRFLRNHLSYQQATFYYVAIGINLIFRLSWTLSISPLVQKLITSPLLPMMIGLIEILRRCMWNFFRIEKQHIVNCRNYAATEDVKKAIQNINAQNNSIEETQSQSNRVIESGFLTESIPYFVRDSDQKFLQTKLLPEGYEAQISEDQISLKKATFASLLEKQHQQKKQY